MSNSREKVNTKIYDIIVGIEIIINSNYMLKRWSVIFKALGSMSRLKIITILAQRNKMIVSHLAKAIDISLKSTSKHLIILKNLDVLDSVGKDGHVHYSLNPNPPADVKKALSLLVGQFARKGQRPF